MLGKSIRVSLVIGVAAWVAAGCVRNIPQDSHSGKDYRYKGAKKIELEDGEGKAKGIVTYPGGDRVDWKFFEIPEGKKGSMKIQIKHTPPRPGLDVAFDVYNAYFERVAQAKPSSRGKRSKSVSVNEVEAGKYYLQIYAPKRMDAGAYRVTVRFQEKKEVAQVDLAALADQIPEPPTLPAVPEPPPPEDPAVAAAKAEEEKKKAEEEAARKAAEDAAKPKPVTAKILNLQVAGDGAVIITLNRGKNDGVERGWSGNILQGGDTGAPLDGGEFKVIKVTSREAVGKVRLSADQLRSNQYARLSPE